MRVANSPSETEGVARMAKTNASRSRRSSILAVAAQAAKPSSTPYNFKENVKDKLSYLKTAIST